MKKALSILIATFVMGLALPILADNSGPELHMNFRFMQVTDNGTPVGGPMIQPSESRIGLHCVEISAAQEVDNIGGALLYRLGDAGTNYPVEAKAYYKIGDFKITEGLQFVPFGIYKWNNLYNPFLDIPGEKGQAWDSDWGSLVTFNAKPVLIDLGLWKGAAKNFGTDETAEKDILTGRIGWDILSNLNVGGSFMAGDVARGLSTTIARTKERKYALDTTWGIVPNLQAEAELVTYKFSPNTDVENMFTQTEKGDYGLLQLKYDIVKVPSPLNRISPVLQYSWDNNKVTPVATGVTTNVKTKNYQEELWVKAGKNLDVFLQFAQEKDNTVGAKTGKKSVLAVKYAFQ